MFIRTYPFVYSLKVRFMFVLRFSLLPLLLGLMLFISFPARSEQNAEPPEAQSLRTDVIPVEEILALNATMRSMVDTYVKPITGKQLRADALYNLMFSADKLALKYDSSHTKTAIETIESGSGNCVSLSNVFVAMARYAGLDAKFLDVEVPENWQRESDVYFQLKHVSASVKVAPGEYLGIEYSSMGPITRAKTQKMDDKAAFAAFYSNLGIELLLQEKMDPAIAYLKYATELDPDSANNWSNLGVAYRRVNQLEQAEDAYLLALKQDKADLTTLNNLAVLYQMTGQEKLSEKYAKKLERYHLQNPYYLIKRAKEEMQTGNYKQALKFTNKAIAKYDDEHEFYFVAAQIYAHQGDMQKAVEYLRSAEKFSLSITSRDLYRRKLELLGERVQPHTPL
jgi:tetratricopeptide (TPR) repeat protein